MGVSTAVDSLDRLSQDVFEVMRHLALAAPRGRRRPGDLREGEFLTLTLLDQRGTMIVGELQRELGVLPAQMSRIIRALESYGQAYITCRINLQDKRKIDVSLTDEGLHALRELGRHRVGRVLDVLRELDDDDLENLARIISLVQETLRRYRHEAVEP